MLKLSLKPGISLGEFVLGKPIRETIEIIKEMKRSVQIKYSEDKKADLVLQFADDGILLIFHNITQCLRRIEVYDVRKSLIDYEKNVLCPSSEPLPTLSQIQSIVSPTTKGRQTQNGEYEVVLHGLELVFVPPKQGETDTSIFELNRIRIKSDTEPLIKGPPFYFEKVKMLATEGTLFFEQRKAGLSWKSCPQDVTMLLGPPDRIFSKQEDKMKINSVKYSGQIACSDYFYNYFNLGIDILFNINTHHISKFILHTNFPSDLNFNLYAKCNFALTTENLGASKWVNNNNESEEETDSDFITPDSTWSEIRRIFNITNEDKTLSYKNSRFCGMRNVILETSRNNTIFSVTIFDPDAK